MRLMKLLSHACAKQKTKRLNGFKFRILLVILSGIMTVKGFRRPLLLRIRKERERERERMDVWGGMNI